MLLREMQITNPTAVMIARTAVAQDEVTGWVIGQLGVGGWGEGWATLSWRREEALPMTYTCVNCCFHRLQ